MFPLRTQFPPQRMAHTIAQIEFVTFRNWNRDPEDTRDASSSRGGLAANLQNCITIPTGVRAPTSISRDQQLPAGQGRRQAR